MNEETTTTDGEGVPVDIDAINAANGAVTDSGRGGVSAAVSDAWRAAVAAGGRVVTVELGDSPTASDLVAARAAVARLAERNGRTVASVRGGVSGTVWVAQRDGALRLIVAPTGYVVTADGRLA